MVNRLPKSILHLHMEAVIIFSVSRLQKNVRNSPHFMLDRGDTYRFGPIWLINGLSISWHWINGDDSTMNYGLGYTNVLNPCCVPVN